MADIEAFDGRLGDLHQDSPDAEESSITSILLAELMSLNKARADRHKNQKAMVGIVSFFHYYF